MAKPTGGRGHKAPYETTHIRIPVPLKRQIVHLIEEYRTGLTGDEPLEDETESRQVLEVVNRFISEKNLGEKMHTRDNTNLKRLVQWLQAKHQ